MGEQKPLPDIPPQARLTTLCSEARDHRSRFIRHILSEIDDPSLERRLDDWARTIEDALDELGACVTREDWLGGFRRRKETANMAAAGKEHGSSEGTGSEKEKEKDEMPHILLQMQKFSSLPDLPSPNPVINHLVLCTAPFGSHVSGVSDTGGLLTPTPQVSCVFMSGNFPKEDVLPNTIVLCGLDDWESAVALSERTQLRVVGGTFAFRGPASLSQQRLLIPILRAAINLHLALILEQHALSDSNVRLKYPRPKYESHSPSEPESLQTINDTTTKPGRGLNLRSTLLNLFSRRVYRNRSSTISSVSEHPGLELSRNRTMQFPRKSGGDDLPRSSLDSIGQRIRRFSIRGGDVHARPKKPTEDPNRPFFTTVSRIENSKDLLSTSFDVSFHPPEVLLNLALQEEKDPMRHLRGKERCALTTLLGWDSKDGSGKEMAGLVGFVRHQSLSVLVSRHVPQPATPPAHSEDEQPPKPTRLTCGRPRRKTFWYYAKGRRRDPTLGEVIMGFSATFPLACEEPGCVYKCGDHQLKFMHNKTRIDVSFSGRDKGECDGNGSGKDGIVMWETCGVCGAKSVMKEMCDGTYLLSFAKYLELLIYSFAIHSSPVCEHTTPRTNLDSDPSKFGIRFSIVRHFATDSCDVTFSLSEERDIFELHLPRLQMYRSGEKTSHPMCPENCQDVSQLEEERTILRRQIKAFFEAVSDYLDNIEGLLAGPDSDVTKKSLPRLPSATDESYENISSPESISTPTMSTYLTTTHMVDPAIHVPATQSVEMDPLRLLSAMRHSFQRTEQSLYAQLSQTPMTSLNDARRSFLAAGRGAQKRTTAWKKKHLPQQQQETIGDLNAPEPEWWDKRCYAFPGGNVLVHEEDWGSIIALTLGSSDYQQELSNMSLSRSSSGTNGEEAHPSQPSTATVTVKGYKMFSNASQIQQLDPDKEGVIWHESETCTAVVTRKEVSRDSASLLSIRDMLRSRTPAEPSGSNHSIKAAVAGGQVSGLPDTVETGGKALQELEAVEDVEALKPEYLKEDTMSVSPVSSLGRMGMGPPSASASTSTVSSLLSDVTVSMRSLPPDVPPKEKDDQGQGQSNKNPSSSLFANTLTNSLSYALRLMSSGQSTPRGSPSQTTKSQHGLEYSIDEKPHIKYEAMVGKRLKLSCTVYYAKQFDLLRKQCGVDDVFVKSLMKSNNWAAEGGKSKSNFWKTSDDRFIIKTLVNAWNVADLHVLLELAPAYFRYAESTASRPTVLVKLLGFYTVEVKNLESGTNPSKVDLMIMENLFYNRKVDKTFDLKGIQGRKVKPMANDPHDRRRRRQTLFDGEWIEGQQKTLMLVRPESKKVLREAVMSDADFLAKMNIMDYSLLLGIDIEGRQITCGLVDTIGSYTFAKTLEYKAKYGLNSGKDVTVIPPVEYEERFVNALEGYFVACPDKWSKPLEEIRILNSADQLPSVL